METVDKKSACISFKIEPWEKEMLDDLVRQKQEADPDGLVTASSLLRGQTKAYLRSMRVAVGQSKDKQSLLGRQKDVA